MISFNKYNIDINFVFRVFYRNITFKSSKSKKKVVKCVYASGWLAVGGVRIQKRKLAVNSNSIFRLVATIDSSKEKIEDSLNRFFCFFEIFSKTAPTTSFDLGRLMAQKFVTFSRVKYD